MKKYNIKIGDYVETTDGAIGYVSRVDAESFTAALVKNGSLSKGFGACELFVQIYALEDNSSIIKQVGIYQFDRISLISKLPTSNFNINSITIKLNELIDHVNAIQERLSKENKQ